MIGEVQTFSCAIEVGEVLREGLQVWEARVHELGQEVHKSGAVVARLRLTHARQEAQLERVTLSVPVARVEQVTHEEHQFEHTREASALSNFVQRRCYSRDILEK